MSASKNLIQAAAGVGVGGDFYSYTIDNSVRFDGSSSYLGRTPSAQMSTYTFSAWLKISGNAIYYIWNSANSRGFARYSYTGTNGGKFYMYIPVSAAYVDGANRDYSAWVHIVVSASSGTANVYKNGVNMGSIHAPTILTSGAFEIGRYSSSQYYYDGYMADVAFIDGQQLDASSFGETKNGVWIPKDISSLTYGTNGFHLDFADSSNLGNDVSGNNNDLTPSGLTSSDQMIDTPTNNIATLNPLINPTGLDSTFYEGNLAMQTNTAANTNGNNTTQSTIAIPSSGKWFFEFRPRSYGGQFNVFNAIGGIAPAYHTINDAGWKHGIEYYNNGNKYINNVSTSYGASWVVGDVIGVLVDVDNVSVTFYKNGASQGEITSATHGFSNFDGWHFTLEDAASTEYVYYDANFGQNGTFNGAVTAGGNSDANGIGDFKYTVPTDALALCTANLPEPTIGPNSAKQSDEHFNTVLWTGNGSTQSITGVGFQPDFTWIKVRTAVNSHYLFDAVRGADLALFSDSSSAETDYTATGRMTSFDTDGFSVKYSSSTGTNASGNTYVGWNWKANGSGSSNTDGSITSTVSANTDAGISIVTYTGNATAGATVGHGLSSAPELVFFKNRGYAYSWLVQGDALGSPASGYYMWLDRTDAVTTNSSVNTTFGGSTITLDNSPAYNQSGYNIVAYCFAEVEGFSKFGSYTGNGSSDGPFIYTGFRPAWFMIKNISTGGTGYDWIIHDTRRSIYNPSDTQLIANSTVIENRDSGNNSSTAEIDILSNGFKHRTSSGGRNLSGNTYIYMAFAENPFKYSNAR